MKTDSKIKSSYVHKNKKKEQQSKSNRERNTHAEADFQENLATKCEKIKSQQQH